jgi:hypothetical protein
MATSCDGCFYEAQRSFIDPCNDCGNGDAYDNWVSVDFLKNVPDDEASIEGEGVMSQMAEQLLQSKPQQGVKYDEDKLQWSLLPFRALKEVVAVLGFGAKKYAPDNWQRVPDASTRYVDAAFRHLTDWQLKERLDGETRKSHLAHAICCLLFLLWFEQEEREDASPRVQ